MKTHFLHPATFAGCLLALGLTALGPANVWVNADFEDQTDPLTQGTGMGYSDPAEADNELDVFSFNPISTQISANLVATGAVSTAKAYQGAACYELEAGESLAIGEPYTDQGNGNYVYMQFAINVDPIPAAGQVAEWRWNLSVGDPLTNYSFYVRLDSDGSKVDITAGEDLAGSSSGFLTSLLTPDDWVFITVQLQKDAIVTGQPDPRDPDGMSSNLLQGVYFYVSSLVPDFSVTNLSSNNGPIAMPDQVRDWAFTVQSGTVYLDEVYYEGGIDTHIVFDAMPPAALDDQNLRPLDSPRINGGSSTTTWAAYDE